MAIKAVGPHGGVGGAAQEHASKAALAQVGRRHAQDGLAHTLPFVFGQQCQHHDFAGVAMAKAVARQLVAIQRDHARIQPGFDPRAPGLLRGPGVSQFGGGHGVLAER
ncbi:hypothetical protein G6F31_015143 [Rhizopus arrhizus]|nr:hypothetical protein G6F31_015143 [Rhizopus arrhizus]